MFTKRCVTTGQTFRFYRYLEDLFNSTMFDATHYIIESFVILVLVIIVYIFEADETNIAQTHTTLARTLSDTFNKILCEKM